jgi:hypothetical protein
MNEMLESSKNYVQNAQIEVMVNYDEFHPNNYGKDKFLKKSKLMSRMFSSQ